MSAIRTLRLRPESETGAATGRRFWLLICWLFLPWLVCGGLLVALVACTPDPTHRFVASSPPYPRSGLAANFTSVHPPVFRAEPPTELVVVWNEHVLGHPEATRTAWDAGGRWGLAVIATHSPQASGLQIAVRPWWLLPFPLLWSGAHLVRWLRRTD